MNSFYLFIYLKGRHVICASFENPTFVHIKLARHGVLESSARTKLRVNRKDNKNKMKTQKIHRI